MPDMSKSKSFPLTGYCPTQGREYSIMVHAVPQDSAWKRFGFTCKYRMEEKQPCEHLPCPLAALPITEEPG